MNRKDEKKIGIQGEKGFFFKFGVSPILAALHVENKLYYMRKNAH